MQHTSQRAIIQALGVRNTFDASAEIAQRKDFLKTYLQSAGMRSYVLGISGGIDSLTAALLAQSTVRELRARGYDASFIAVRLPYGVQADEQDAQKAINVIEPDTLLTINIKPASDAAFEELRRTSMDLGDASRADYLLGNIKARQRMIAQFAVAGAARGLVIGTDHAGEALMGFFTKFGDGAADILPLSGLNKRRVRAVAEALGAPKELVYKVPTADLENSAPLKPDEDAYGVTYDEIDDFLEGKRIAPASEERILQAYRSTAHKRALPFAPV